MDTLGGWSSVPLISSAISNQHAQQTVGKHDWWQAGHPLKTALENPSGSRQYVAVPCSWTPTLPPVGDDTWSMVLFPYDLNKFSPKHKIGHLCASLSAEEKHLDWSEREGFWFFGILIINYHWFLFTKTFMRQWYLKPSITCALPHMINYYDFSIT